MSYRASSKKHKSSSSSFCFIRCLRRSKVESMSHEAHTKKPPSHHHSNPNIDDHQISILFHVDFTEKQQNTIFSLNRCRACCCDSGNYPLDSRGIFFLLHRRKFCFEYYFSEIKRSLWYQRNPTTPTDLVINHKYLLLQRWRILSIWWIEIKIFPLF